MTEEEQARLQDLCLAVIAEKDPDKFEALVEQVNELLSSKEERLNNNSFLN
jgi:hypothetical protein